MLEEGVILLRTQNPILKKINRFPQITAKAEADKGLKFVSLAHHINKDLLNRVAFELKANKATGIDNVTAEEFMMNLHANVDSIVARLKAKSYRPHPVKRVYIPKPGKDEKRPLGIPATEDKLVQLGIKHVLESIYETDFLDCSHGFRPERSCHTAIIRMDKTVMTKPVNYVVEVDIRKFFDNVNHYWLLRCLEERIGDPNFLWLIRQFLKAGIMEEGVYLDSESGTPQGGVVSPLLANIYLHYVLDLWFEKKYKKSSNGYMELIRYCDDFVVLFEKQNDAERFLDELRERLAKFGLQVAEDKTRLLEFGRLAFARSRKTDIKADSFNFLGFTHYWKCSRRGKFIMGHKTSKDNLRRKLGDMKEWLKSIRTVPQSLWYDTLKRKLSGHYNYFGISGNFRCLCQYYHQVVSLLFKWLNRRSQKRSFNWHEYLTHLEKEPLPHPRIMVNIYAF